MGQGRERGSNISSMGQADMKIKCPTCKAKHEPVADGDGTYTETCINCGEPYSYVVKDGKVEEWRPPSRIRQIWSGLGTAGGK